MCLSLFAVCFILFAKSHGYCVCSKLSSPLRLSHSVMSVHLYGGKSHLRYHPLRYHFHHHHHHPLILFTHRYHHHLHYLDASNCYRFIPMASQCTQRLLCGIFDVLRARPLVQFESMHCIIDPDRLDLEHFESLKFIERAIP